MGIKVPLIGVEDQTIPNITVNGTGIPLIRPVTSSVRPINNINVADTRVWLNGVPTVTPIEPPVVVNAGTPVVFMPGKECDSETKQHIANMMTVITTSTFALYAAEK